MTGIWLDNPNYPPQSDPFNNSGNIQGISTYINGDALLAKYTPFTINNSGALLAASSGNGIELAVGGAVTNGVGGIISGAGFGDGILIGNGALLNLNVTNYGTVTGFFGIDIAGYGLVDNRGRIAAAGNNSEGVHLSSGILLNGVSAASAIISGAFAVVIDHDGRVQNKATIIGTTAGTAGIGVGVDLTNGGTVTNGTTGISTALIAGGFEGVDLEGSGGTFINYGTVTGSYAVVARPGSIVRNRAGGTVIGARDGIFLGSPGYPAVGAGMVSNYGLVQATDGATLGHGIVMNTQTASVSNFGTVIGTGSGGPQSSTGLGLPSTTAGLCSTRYPPRSRVMPPVYRPARVCCRSSTTAW